MRIGKCWKEWKVRFGIRKMGFLERERMGKENTFDFNGSIDNIVANKLKS